MEDLQFTTVSFPCFLKSLKLTWGFRTYNTEIDTCIQDGKLGYLSHHWSDKGLKG